MKIPLGRIILERRGLPKTMVTENGRTFLRDWEVYGNTEGGQVKLSWSLENKMETCPAASPSAKVCLSDVLVQQIKSFLKHC